LVFSGSIWFGVVGYMIENAALYILTLCLIVVLQEDLESALKRAFKQQQRVNPALRVNTDIQVGSFEDVLRRMESNEEETGWGDIVFIPPGMDALSHLGKSQATVVG